MATGNAESKWPVAKFNFSVRIGNTEALFQEVSGLNTETQPIEYRKGNKQFSAIKMPGIQKFGNVTLKKGVFKNDKALWELYEAVKMNTIKRETIIISLLDETNSVVMTWTLSNAFPAKITAADLKADGNEVAVETIELAHEGLKIDA